MEVKFWIAYKKTDGLHIEWEKVLQRVATNDKEWQGMTKSDNELELGTTSDKEWQRVIANDNEWEWEQIKLSDFKFQNEKIGQSGSWRVLFNFLCNI